MVRAAEPPAVPLARARPARWRRGVPQTQTAYVGVALAALVVVIWILAPVFMTPRNLLNISKNFSFIALMSLGETLVIISGGIDLSVGSVCALSAVVTMMLMRVYAVGGNAQAAALAGVRVPRASGESTNFRSLSAT
jgi:ribose transport system permease protein